MSFIQDLYSITFSAKSLPMVTCGGFVEEGGSTSEVKLLSGARKHVFQNFGNIYMDSGSSNQFLDLFVQGHLSETQTMNLFLSGAYHSIDGSLPLVAWNEFESGSMALFASGLGGEAGALPINESLNLFIKRSFANYLALYLLGGPQPSSFESLNLTALGGSYETNSLFLSIPYVTSTENGSLPLYTHGF